ncbi:phosphatase PAP2 family protein [Streptomyces sp. NPDC050164]|uniref:phosphatase PAP2 family protein n=1 Tax=Streptomyces sp. NPDC050164 TaxID=3365605 RepID=UPI0037B9DB64
MLFTGTLALHLAIVRVPVGEHFLAGAARLLGQRGAVVTWGILTYPTSPPRVRRRLSAWSAAMALGIGLTTVSLGTHWPTDVLLGWSAGLLVLLALPCGSSR